MTLKHLLFLIGLATGLLWLAWFWILISIDPFITNIVGFLFFYITLFLSLVGTLALAGFMFRKARLKAHADFHLVSVSFRQSVILSILLTSLLVLQGLGWLAWWNVLIILILVITAEAFILSKQKRNSVEISFSVSTVQNYIPSDPQFTKRSVE